MTGCHAVRFLAFSFLVPLLGYAQGNTPNQTIPAQTPAQTTAAHPAAASKTGPLTTLSAEARLVNLPVVVRDRKGALVSTLTQNDFTLSVDGAVQPIRYFDRDQDVPLTLGLLVDTSLSQRKVLDSERAASEAFLNDMLATAKDQAFVIQFARSTELLQDVTSSKPRLEAGLKDLDTSTGADSENSGSDTDSNGDRRRSSHGGIVLYDATFLASDELMSKQKGRKALILLTDGVDRNSKETIARAIEAAQRADTTLYAIFYKGESPRDNNNSYPGRQRGGGYPFPGGGGYPGGGYPGGRGGGQGGNGGNGNGRLSEVDGRKILERMTGETGGRVFEVKGKDDVASIYKQIGEELRAQYRLGYTPDATHASEGYHQVDLQLKDAKLKDTVQTRDGYYSGKS